MLVFIFSWQAVDISKHFDFIKQWFLEQLKLGAYKNGWWKLVKDNVEKNCKLSRKLKKQFFSFFSFLNREKSFSFFLIFLHPLLLSSEDSFSSHL